MGYKRKDAAADPNAVFTTGQVSKFCRVAPRTISKWFDAGQLEGYRIPGSSDRRVRRQSLVAFMKKHNMPTDLVPGGETGGGRVLAIGLQAAVVAHLFKTMGSDGLLLTVIPVTTEFDGVMQFAHLLPDVIVASASSVERQFAARVHSVCGCERMPVVAVFDDHADRDTLALWKADGWAVVTDILAEVVRAAANWRSLTAGQSAAR